MIAAVVFLASNAPAALTTNSWANTASGTWSWATDGNWSLNAAPSINQSAIFITNAVSAPSGQRFRTVSIDNVVAQFAPNTMTISNLTVSGLLSGTIGSHNNLLLNNANNASPPMPLHILHSLIISNGGSLIMTNSVLISDSTSTPSGQLSGTWIYGLFQLQSGLLLTVDTNSVFSTPFAIDNNGQMTVLGGTWQGDSAGVANGTLFLAGGTVNISAGLGAAGFSATGTIFMTSVVRHK